MTFLLALLPILLIVFLMIGRRWGATPAGLAGYLSAILIGAAAFGAGPQLLIYAHLKALLLTFDVLLIIWGAFLFYRVTDEAGVIRILGQALPTLTADRDMQALIIGWVFASFLQGVGGFGVPVAVISPLLVGLGFAPLTAVVIPSLGHGWAVTFGSLGSSFQALLAATRLPEALLAPPAALFLGVSGVLVGGMAAHVAGGWQAVRRLLGPILLLGAAMSGVQYLVATSSAWNIGAFCGGLAGLALGVPLAYRSQRKKRASNSAILTGNPEHLAAFDKRSLVVALSGYAILILITLSVQLIPAFKSSLGGVMIRFDFPELRTASGYITPAGPGRSIPLLIHAGALLAYAALIAALVYRQAGFYTPGAGRRILLGTYKKVGPPSLSILLMVTMAVIMENAGMTTRLAEGIAGGMGALFPLAAPWIGALGAFMTGSNTNSNVVFGALQMRTAQILGYSVAFILAGQTAGAALASVMAPAKVVVGASTAGMAGQEGIVMRKLAGYTLLLVGLISLLTAAGVFLSASLSY